MKLCAVTDDDRLWFAAEKNVVTVVVITMVNMNLTEMVLKW